MPTPARSSQPFVDELPQLLKKRGLSIRQVAIAAGVNPSHLSRVLRRNAYKTPGPELAKKVAAALDLPADYFPEYRRGAVIERLDGDPEFRDRIYDEM